MLTELTDIRAAVRDNYAQIATKDATDGCCGSDASECSSATDYSPDELGVLPKDANLGLGCGNPTALTSLAPGEVVLDLGSGGGIDVFLAGSRVGASGKAIGVDMTAEMLTRARANTPAYEASTGLANVEFRLGEIEHLPVADSSVDVVVSNCVINLSTDKAQVWREIARVLKPGGRVAVSDIALLQALPPVVRESVGAYVGCVGGAVRVQETVAMAAHAGLIDVAANHRQSHVAANVAQWDDRSYANAAREASCSTDANPYIASVDVTARKPRGDA